MSDPATLMQGAAALFGGTSGAPSSATSLGGSEGFTGSKSYTFGPPANARANVTGQAISVDWLVLAGLAVAALWIAKRA